MVVLSASICTSAGKALVSRQFVEMTRMRVEGLFAAFPKLMVVGSEHTFVETDTVRYVYQPLDNNLFLLLLTTKASNIVEDLSTLRLLAKVVPDVAGGMSENHIQESAFELVFAMDEVLTAGGYREEATLTSIRNNLLMDSHEEKMALMIENEKKKEAKRVMDQRAKELQKQKMDHLKNNILNSNASSAPISKMEGFGGGGYANQNNNFMDAFQPDNGSNNNNNNPYSSHNPYNPYESAPSAPEPPRNIAKGMTLGKTKKKDSVMAGIAAEDNLSLFAGISSKSSKAIDDQATSNQPPSTPVSLVLEEKIRVTMSREGVVESSEVKGTLSLTAHTDVGSLALVSVNKPPGFNFATHPKVNKPTYDSKGLLGLKGNKGFPLNRPVGILRWSSNSPDVAPLTINCWPEEEADGTMNVNIDLELLHSNAMLSDVQILVPLSSTDPPNIQAIEGQYKCENAVLCWYHNLIDSSNPNASIEFSIPGSDADAFFPIQISFQSQSLLCPLQINSITSSSTNQPIPDTIKKSLTPDSYIIQ